MSTDDQEVSAGERAGGALATFALLPFAYAWWGWIAATLWRWFVMPTFPAAPALRPAVAVGLFTFLQLAHGSRDKSAYEDVEGLALLGKFIGREFVVPAFALLTGYIAWRLS